MRRNTLLVLVVAVVIAVGLVWYQLRDSSGTGEEERAGEASSGAGPAGPTGAARGAGIASTPRDGGAPAARGMAHGEARAKRDALRAQIARQLASREAVPGAGTGAAGPSTVPRPPGSLRNNLGGRDALVAHLNQELMPLASECIEQAQARSPQLAGMLAISLETIADEQLGAVVEVADPAPGNNVLDPLLLECIRESAFSLTLPPPLTSGRERFELTLPVGSAPGADVPR